MGAQDSTASFRAMFGRHGLPGNIPIYAGGKRSDMPPHRLRRRIPITENQPVPLPGVVRAVLGKRLRIQSALSSTFTYLQIVGSRRQQQDEMQAGFRS
jgi:hypothetical protein